MSSFSADPIATGIPIEHLPLVWPGAWRLLEPAWRSGNDHSDVLAQLQTLDCQLWCVYSGDQLISGIVTRLLKPVGTSGDLNCRIWLVGGSSVRSWVNDLLPKLSAWARSEGCVKLSASGRKGWDRLARSLGWKAVGIESGQTIYEVAL